MSIDDTKLIEILVGIIIVLGGYAYSNLSKGIKEAHNDHKDAQKAIGRLYEKMDMQRDKFGEKLDERIDHIVDRFHTVDNEIGDVKSSVSEILGLLRGKGYINGGSRKG